MRSMKVLRTITFALMGTFSRGTHKDITNIIKGNKLFFIHLFFLFDESCKTLKKIYIYMYNQRPWRRSDWFSCTSHTKYRQALRKGIIILKESW